ncbi:MAG: regulatory protein RecX [Gammaproteobacteria bacterium]|nr:regulatory protein RecX [Gammaproteobacteria bacterium]
MSEEAGRDDLLAQAMRWLARREYSVHELRRRLQGKGYPAPAVDEALADLESRGLVSDRRFAESLVRSRVERGYGPLKITHELRAKGVDDSLIDEAVGDDDAYWGERLQEFWEKRYGRAPDDYREWARQARALQARGFTAAQVRQVIPDIDT